MSQVTDEPSSTWVLLRGLTREAGHWGDFPALLAQALPAGSRILTPDLPGNGHRWRERSPDTVPALRQDLQRWLATEGIADAVHVIAMSLGAMVALDWAQAHPAGLHSLTLINTSVRSHSHFWQRLRPGQYGRVLALAAGWGDAIEQEQRVMRMTCRHPAHADATLARWVALRTLHPVSRLNGWRQLRAAMGHVVHPSAPHVPMLVLHSARDGLVHPACSKALSRAWELPRREHPTAGHDLPQDDGAWVVRAHVSWLGGLDPAQSCAD